ncbi:hypothetical protein PFICI_08213 [Pestalotiopsis fici W106-1]|uniref:Uncharacterized protein n=1 Tax=Pestalotiopsis fici (strain W106-1 / CGMCC3.15140) TaxID=1229662 RepID=W3X3V0_PESFW|nr:uncharacterized protein PFICI_08213 [Pestalotiopsis fici W106-1]ETS80684.1 hypothetical protein PFICI_08213 [Pestalotiopsis fici W106-1]
MASNQPESENDEWVMVPNDIESSQEKSVPDDGEWVDLMADFKKLITSESSDGSGMARGTTTSEEPPQPPTDALMSDEEYFNIIHSLWRDISTSHGTELLDRFSYDMNIFHMFRYAWLCRYTETLPSSASSASASHPHSNSVPSIDVALRSPLYHLKIPFSFWRKF